MNEKFVRSIQAELNKYEDDKFRKNASAAQILMNANIDGSLSRSNSRDQKKRERSIEKMVEQVVMP